MTAFQKLAITGSPTGGHYTLSYTPQGGATVTTGNIAYNAAAAAIQTALQALSGLGSVVVAGVYPNFVVDLSSLIGANPVSLLVATPALTGGTSPAIAITSMGEQSAGQPIAQKTFPETTGAPYIQTAPTITANSAYSSGQTLGGALCFPKVCDAGAPSGVITAAELIDQSSQDAEIELWIFNQPFTSPGNSQTWNPSEADLLNLVGIIDFAAADYANGDAISVCYEPGLEVDFRMPTDNARTLYGQLVCRGAPTYTGTNHITVGIAGYKN